MLEFLGKIAKPIGIGLGAALLIGVAALLDPDISKNPHPNYKPYNFDANFKKKDANDGKAILTANDLQQLRWMSVSQLKAIFEGRRKYYKIDNSPEVYAQLRWMSKEQLEAIFGTSEVT